LCGQPAALGCLQVDKVSGSTARRGSLRSGARSSPAPGRKRRQGVLAMRFGPGLMKEGWVWHASWIKMTARALLTIAKLLPNGLNRFHMLDPITRSWISGGNSRFELARPRWTKRGRTISGGGMPPTDRPRCVRPAHNRSHPLVSHLGALGVWRWEGWEIALGNGKKEVHSPRMFV